jgi:hypothetical protein
VNHQPIGIATSRAMQHMPNNVGHKTVRRSTSRNRLAHFTLVRPEVDAAVGKDAAMFLCGSLFVSIDRICERCRRGGPGIPDMRNSLEAYPTR